MLICVSLCCLGLCSIGLLFRGGGLFAELALKKHLSVEWFVLALLSQGG